MWRHRVRHWRDRADGHHVVGLMWIEAEDGPSQEFPRPGFDDADVEVSVLDRPRKVTLLEGGPHRLVLVFGYSTTQDEGLGSPADTRPERADQDLVGSRFGECDETNLTSSS